MQFREKRKRPRWLPATEGQSTEQGEQQIQHHVAYHLAEWHREIALTKILAGQQIEQQGHGDQRGQGAARSQGDRQCHIAAPNR